MAESDELARLRRQLEEARRELDAFGQAVGHDLRAPLRHILGFADLLQRETAGSLGAKAQSHLRTLQGAAAGMERMFNGLGELLRCGREPLRPRRVQLGPLLAELAAGFQEAFPGRQIRWEIADLPALEADPELLRRLLAALLDNAVKFTGERELALIQVRAESAAGEVQVLIEDNGCGFNPGHVERLFAPFQRLHPPEPYPGLGLGLALAKRIVLLHGGRIWAEGEPGRGARFAFALPDRA